MHTRYFNRSLAALLIFVPAVASAHIGVPSGRALANVSGQKITFAVSHGCSVGNNHYDTLSITIDIPTTGPDPTTVRAMPSVGLDDTPTVVKNGTSVTSVTWAKDPADLLTDDVAYYEVTLRMKINDVPFTRIPFTVTQVCRPFGGTSGDDVTTVWTGASEPTPAPRVTVVPNHGTGWLKHTLTAAVAAADFGVYFGDAQIVWKGTQAFSANKTIEAMITMTPGVTALTTDLAVGDVIWVKY